MIRTETYSESCQTLKIELFVKTANGFQPLNIATNSSILDVWEGSEPTFAECYRKFNNFLPCHLDGYTTRHIVYKWRNEAVKIIDPNMAQFVLLKKDNITYDKEYEAGICSKTIKYKISLEIKVTAAHQLWLIPRRHLHVQS